ncbi:ornithine carbamoyltransferase [Salmonella enterica subsp. enterica]|nr:ornithine carbamoyltransferase [Salmonella enterica subsp. enterica serovar Telhashomer]ECF6833033.1 ornithine carbamoyltransferase [Salmonella enterica subsp. enterica]ECW0241988.1 ornithine carbamoyltransferase [Salmonella enterica subsp. enterica serovar Telhashomer]EGI6283367.1 ornithine carbamoyltransferase [Salmonella enterica subsp. enterica serovar Telhashomer]
MALQISKVYEICQEALNNPYSYGTNDCNIVAIRILDSIGGTDWESKADYDSLLSGIKNLKELGFESTADIIKQHSDKVKYTIDGDIWLDPDNPHTVSIVVSDRLLGVNKEHTEFNIVPRRKDGDYYRIRK